VSSLVRSGRPNEHPEINKPTPKPKRLKGEKTELRDMREAARKGDLSDLYGNKVKPEEVTKMVDSGRVLKKGTPG
jgi:hypothetical protein